MQLKVTLFLTDCFTTISLTYVHIIFGVGLGTIHISCVTRSVFTIKSNVVYRAFDKHRWSEGGGSSINLTKNVDHKSILYSPYAFSYQSNLPKYSCRSKLLISLCRSRQRQICEQLQIISFIFFRCKEARIPGRERLSDLRTVIFCN